VSGSAASDCGAQGGCTRSDEFLYQAKKKKGKQLRIYEEAKENKRNAQEGGHEPTSAVSTSHCRGTAENGEKGGNEIAVLDTQGKEGGGLPSQSVRERL